MIAPDSTLPLLNVENLCIDIVSENQVARRVLNGVNFRVNQHEVVALVGESGSGKTLTARAILKLLPNSAQVSDGQITFEGTPLSTSSEDILRSLRGNRIGMVFQEPMVSLNPALTIGSQMMEAIRLHKSMSRSEARQQCIAMLKRVSISDPLQSLRAYPRQFSGGMRQRIMLASALLLRPTLLIADEPTTALDAIICKDILDLMISLTRELGTAILFISHDIGIVAERADKAVVLRNGEVIDQGTVNDVILAPRKSYTQDLLSAMPTRRSNAQPTSSATSHIKCAELSVTFGRKSSLFRKHTLKRVIDNITLSINKSENLALVGESGSGKTTFARALLRLCSIEAGRIQFDSQDVLGLGRQQLAKFRSKTQMVFQDPYSSLDPRMTVGQIVMEALRHDKDLDRLQRQNRTKRVLEEVGLSSSYVDRYPHELSGGQRQRVSIARSVVGHPMFLVADEPVSALDVTIQHQVLELLKSLQQKYQFTCLLISHDLAVVEEMSDRVAVMFRGQLLEIGPIDRVYDNPQHPYTARLLNATPRIRTCGPNQYEVITMPLTSACPPDGYEFLNRGSIPDTTNGDGTPILLEIEDHHFVTCVPTKELSCN